jgi:N-acetylglutamate synthase-like GNAT family acetyltransferase
MLLPEVNIYQDQYKDKIINLILDIQIGEFGVPITIKDQPDLDNISSFYQKGAGNFWVALSGDKIIGTIALIDIGNSQCVLRKMFVAKEYRGKDKGVAQQLLATLLEWCKLKKINEIYLGTVATYFAAHRFYEKNGFTEIQKNLLPANFPIMAVDTKFYKYEFMK